MKKLSYYERLLTSLARLNLREIDILLIDNVWNDLSNEQLSKVKNYLNKYLSNPETTCLFSCSHTEKLEDLSLKNVSMHAGILEV